MKQTDGPELWQGQIGRRIVGVMILASAALSVVAAALQLYLGYQRDLGDVSKEFEIVEDSFLPGLESALWEFNFPLVEVLLDGIAAQPDVVNLSLQATTGQSWTRANGYTDARTLSREFALVHSEGLPAPRSVGTLTVFITLEFVQQRLLQDFFTLILSYFAKTLLASLVMLAIFDRMVSRHLRQIALMTRDYPWLTGERPLTLERKAQYQDELTQIVGALNVARVQNKLVHDKVIAKNHELEMTADKLAETNREQAEFTYSISHDLKAPTNTIRMLADELMEYGEVDADGREILTDIVTTTTRMGQLVDDVLHYSRLIEERPTFEEVDLSRSIDGVVRDLAGEISAAGAMVSYANLPTVMGHPLQLRILFQNLIANALKFRVPDRVPVVKITSDVTEGRTRITVADNGIGIPEKHREAVFGLFKRLHNHSEYPGTGLGLTICKRVMFNHGGSISLSNGIDGGTAFALEFKATEHDETN